MSEHTPIPWKASDDRKDFIGQYGEKEGWNIWTEDGTAVVAFSPSYGACGEADANFIIKAVNSHDQLVEALKMLEYNEEGIPDTYPSKAVVEKALGEV